MLITEASRWIGVSEIGGDNRGQLVEMFQKAVDGKAMREPWCAAFVWFCIKAIDEICDATKIPGFTSSKSPLFRSEHVLTIWERSPVTHRETNPLPGHLVLWRYFDEDGNATTSGHIGIVAEVKPNDGSFQTIEGNTSATGNLVVREGDVVAYKRRFLSGSRRMKIQGFLRVW